MVILLKSILGRNRSLFESSVEKEISSDAGEKFPASLLVETEEKTPHLCINYWIKILIAMVDS